MKNNEKWYNDKKDNGTIMKTQFNNDENALVQWLKYNSTMIRTPCCDDVNVILEWYIHKGTMIENAMIRLWQSNRMMST